MKTVFGGAVAILLSLAPAWAQSITPMSEWVPNIDQVAATARTHQLSEVPTKGAVAAKPPRIEPAGR